MKDIINWLRDVEHLASDVYQQAATYYSRDTVLSKFFSVLAEEEVWHYQVMGSAATYLDSERNFHPAISIDQETGDRIISYFLDLRKGISTDTISREGILEKIVEAELSESNDIFFYVVSNLKERTNEFKYPAARIQAHVKGIEYFLSEVEKRPDILEKIIQLPPVLVEKILIVEDNPMIAELIRSLLNREGKIDVVHNGRDALEQIKKNYYKLIVSDIDMPIMDGLTLYKQSIATYPKLNSRYLFITGDLSQDRVDFFIENNIKYLSKPMEIKQLREKAYQVIMSE